MSGWWARRRERTRRSAAGRAFRRAFKKTLTERTRLDRRWAASMARIIAVELPEERAIRTLTCEVNLDSTSTKQLPSDRVEERLFGIAAACVSAAFQSLKDIEATQVVVQGRLIDSRGWEDDACVLSVAATRETAESLNWQNLNNRQVLENFDLLYASGRAVVPHGVVPEAASDLCQDLMALSPTDFEKLIVDLFGAMGYVTQHTGRTGDRGIDLIAFSATPVSGGNLVIQCKRYAAGNNVGESEVRDLYGVVADVRANKGILVTTSDFTPAARKFAAGKQIELINGSQLSGLLEKHLGQSSPASEAAIELKS